MDHPQPPLSCWTALALVCWEKKKTESLTTLKINSVDSSLTTTNLSSPLALRLKVWPKSLHSYWLQLLLQTLEPDAPFLAGGRRRTSRFTGSQCSQSFLLNWTFLRRRMGKLDFPNGSLLCWLRSFSLSLETPPELSAAMLEFYPCISVTMVSLPGYRK